MPAPSNDLSQETLARAVAGPGYPPPPMVGSTSSSRLRAQVRVACGRVAVVAAAMLEAHRFGVAEGPHERPWALAYHREAVRIFAQTLPDWYQSDIAALFGRCAETMAGCSIPAQLAEDWVIVTGYLTSARRAILEWVASADPDSRPAASSSREPVTEQDTPPLVIRFDALAKLTTSDGARRLHQATVAVRQHMEAPVPETFDERELKLLNGLANGETIADLATEMGYSERSIYRALANLWKKLGVPGRKQGVQEAARSGLLKAASRVRAAGSG